MMLSTNARVSSLKTTIGCRTSSQTVFDVEAPRHENDIRLVFASAGNVHWAAFHSRKVPFLCHRGGVTLT